jgi:hypothetical protein
LTRAAWPVALCAAWAAAMAAASDTPADWTWQAPNATERRRTANDDWRPFDAVEMDVRLLARSGPPGPVRLYFFLQNKQDMFFQTQYGLLLDGTRQTLRIELDETRATLHSVNARRPLAPDALRWVREWGLKIQAPDGAAGQVRIGAPRWIAARPQPLRVANAQWPRQAPPGAVAPVRFDVPGFRGDPFCAAAIDAALVADGPAGQQTVPAFWTQDYRLVKRPGAARATPVATGRPRWQANWKPPQPGRYRLHLRIAAEARTWTEPLGDVRIAENNEPKRAAAASEEDAAVRFTQALDAPLFTTDGQRWQAHEQDPAPDRAWTVRLDWTAEWGRFTGMGEFDLQAAWELEQQLDRYATSGPPRPVRLFGTDELRRHGTYNWLSHPFNRSCGGHLEKAYRLLGDPAADEALRKRARYLWARFGTHAAVCGLLVQAPEEAPHVTEWVRRMARELRAIAPDLVLLSDNPGLPAREWQTPLELFADLDPRLQADRQAPQRHADPAPPRRATLRAREPDRPAPSRQDDSGLSYTVRADLRPIGHWAGAAGLAVDILAPGSPEDDLKVMAFARTDRLQIYDSPLRTLDRETWNRVAFALDDPQAWTCAENPHRHPGPYEWLNVREFGLRFFSAHDEPVTVALRNETLRGPYTFRRARRAALAVERTGANSEPVPQYEKFEAIFRVNRVFANPYDPTEVEATLIVEGPDGREVRHPAFFYEPWRLVRRDGRETVAREKEEPSWRARFAPWQVGRHRWRLRLRAGSETAETQGRFECVPGRAPGFVRVSERDPRYFEFSGGDFFFPLGHNLRSPGDERAAKQGAAVAANARRAEALGVQVYDQWFRKMREHGQNFGRVWLAPWWLGLEWNEEHAGYHGLGYYHQGNAARLDRLMTLAEEHGIYLNLETFHHGAISSRVDTDWERNPLNRHTRPGGYLSYATEFFDSERAQREHRNRLRYMIARWGYSRAIAWWGVLTETEWVEAYYRAIRGREKMPDAPWVPQPFASREHRPKVVRWLAETARYVRETDAHPHPVTAQFSMPQHGTELWGRPEAEIVHNNAYTAWIQWWRAGRFEHGDGVADVIYTFADLYDRHARRKPLMVGEWGGHPHGSPAGQLTAELRTGLWTMAMTRCAGAAGFWWWNLVDEHNLYPRFDALARFMAGEDRRGADYQWERLRPVFPAEKEQGDFSTRQGVALFNKNRLRAYLFCKAVNRRNHSAVATGADDERFSLSGEGQMTVPEIVADGPYRLQYWDPATGRILKEVAVVLNAERRTLPLLAHRVDLALKLDRQQPEPAP